MITGGDFPWNFLVGWSQTWTLRPTRDFPTFHHFLHCVIVSVARSSDLEILKMAADKSASGSFVDTQGSQEVSEYNSKAM